MHALVGEVTKPKWHSAIPFFVWCVLGLVWFFIYSFDGHFHVAIIFIIYLLDTVLPSGDKALFY